MNLPRLLFRLLLGRRLPTIKGTLTVPGVHQDIVIRRDSWGIPCVDAANEFDAWFGLGFCHGQDRTFQLEILLRLIHGTLAELVGPEALILDRLARRVGLLHTAKNQLAFLEPAILEMLEAYTTGINAAAGHGLPRVPHEFALLRSRPTPWSPVDVLGLFKLLSFSLVSNWDIELARYRILTLDGPEALARLDPAYAEWHPVTTPTASRAGPALDYLSESLAAFRDQVKLSGGSNNWALGPAVTRRGRPIVANDPHLPGIVPSQWYLAHLRTPQWQVSGASFVGGPVFPTGHNEHAAWGVTVGLIDNTDLFLEELGPDGKTVREGNRFIPCSLREERIKVKDGTEEIVEVLSTPRGPIISPALTGVSEVFSLRATWLDPYPVKGLLALPWTRDFDSFRQNVAQWPGLAFNVAFADTAGNYGWQMVGSAPQRRRGHGALPLPGWDAQNAWRPDLVPFEDMPFVKNPEIGFVVTANNKPTADGAGPFLSADFADGYRCAIIGQYLAKRRDWDVPLTADLQTDLTSLPYQEIRPLLESIPEACDAVRQAKDLMQFWDGKISADSPSAAVFELFTSEMARRLAQALAPRSYEWALGRGVTPLAPVSLFGERRISHLVRHMQEQTDGIFKRSWPEEMADALMAVVNRLRSEFGKDPEGWEWGRVRPTTLRHPLGRKRPLDRIFNLGPLAVGGDANTIPQATVTAIDPTGDPAYIPSARMVVEVGNWQNNRFILPGGQSGNPCSPHFDDQLTLWLKNETLSIPWTEEEIVKKTRATLRLVPQ